MATPVELAAVAIRPEAADNVAIVTRDLDPGTVIRNGDAAFTLDHRVLEGHRIVVEPIQDGGPLLSWSTPFARARGDRAPGDYVCTATSLAALRSRGVLDLPEGPTAVNEPLDPYRLDEAALHIGTQLGGATPARTFLGHPRRDGRVGTRNHVVILGVSADCGAFVTALATRLQAHAPAGMDGVVPVAHTEAGEAERPNNLRFLLTVLAGCCVHPNVGAVLVVDDPRAAVTATDLRAFLATEGYPPIGVPHDFFSRTGDFATDMVRAADLVQPWLAPLAAARRSEQPVDKLVVALQCGGSDAFSGITANPLAGSVSAEVIRHGGAAVLSETDELIGAEAYVLANVASAQVARAFLAAVRAFQERVSWHGHSAEGNPSGGNVYRGLYNIVLKSVGAARKLDRRVRLDHVIDYGAPLPGPGMTFMDSPGNDLESVAGQVATGANLIFFTTGNGSITNFPFVPTLKFVTTTRRYELLRDEMDVDAGRYLTGTPMPQLVAETFDLTLDTASGTPSAGERAGHSQVSIWRNWRQTRPRPGIAVSIDGRRLRDPGELPAAERDAPLPGQPLPVRVHRSPPTDVSTALQLYEVDGRRSPERLALVLPTSLCAGQVALRIAEQAEREQWHRGWASRTVALPHTEGCGVTGGASEDTYARMMTGYLAHPSVAMALLLEHGCEKTHNDYFRARLLEAGRDPARYGWASIQRDGGIEAVTERVRRWFADTATTLDSAAGGQASGPAAGRVSGALGDLTIGLAARGPLPTTTAHALAELGGWVVTAGGTVILAADGVLLGDRSFREHAFGTDEPVQPTLAHGQRPAAPGWQVMRTPTTDWVETASGLGAGGVQLLVVHVAGGTPTGQRLVPVVRVSADPATVQRFGPDLDATLDGDAAEQARTLADLLVRTASGAQGPRALATGDVGFQVTRGLLGTSV